MRDFFYVCFPQLGMFSSWTQVSIGNTLSWGVQNSTPIRITDPHAILRSRIMNTKDFYMQVPTH